MPAARGPYDWARRACRKAGRVGRQGRPEALFPMFSSRSGSSRPCAGRGRSAPAPPVRGPARQHLH
eukprot:6197277-Pyramimonas_sp.AAC.1